MKREKIIGLLLFFIICSLNFWFKDQLIFSSQELRLWGSLQRNVQSPQMFDLFLSTIPLSLSNLYGLILYLVHGNFIFLSTLSICLFLFFIHTSIRGKSLTHQLVFILLILNPFSLWVIISRPVDLFITSVLFVFTRGLLMTESKNLGRGMLLMSFSALFLVLSGRLGISFLFAVFCLLPLFFKTEIFQRSTLGGYSLIAFPTIASFLGVFYLAWLFGVDPKKLLIGEAYRVTRNLEFVDFVIYGLMGLSLYFSDTQRNLINLIQNQKGIITLGLTALVFYFFGEGCPYDVLIGIGTIAVAVGLMNREHLKTPSVIVVCLLQLILWISFFQSKQSELTRFSQYQPILTNETWSNITAQLRKSSKTLFLTPHFSVFTISSNVNPSTTPITPDYTSRLLGKMWTDFDFILVENPMSDIQDQNALKNHLSRIYYGLEPDLQLVYSQENFKLFKSKRSLPTILVTPKAIQTPLSSQTFYDWVLLIVLSVSYLFYINLNARKKLQNSP